MSTKAQHGPTARQKARAAPTSPSRPPEGEHGATLAAHAGAQRARARGGGQNRGLTLLTPEVEAKILAGIRDAGMSLQTACAWAGISDDTLARQRKKDPELAARVERAREMFKAKMVTLISAAAPKNWNAAAWLLERKHPEEFGRQRLETEHSGGVKITIEGGLPKRPQ
jgi:hypothetical protein